jgi:radical SAM protein with 4Fe4S-binding SPASM domain
MSLSFFEQVLIELRPYTKSLAFHLMGDPLTLSNLLQYLELAEKYGFEVELTTSGYYLAKTPMEVLFHNSVRQLNISLNAYNKNSLNLSFDAYMEGVFLACGNKLEHYPKPFINLRVWNLDVEFSEAEFNKLLFEKLEGFFGVKIDADAIYKEKIKSLRLASKILLNFDNYFEWPSLKSTHESDSTCHGLKSHIGILADGTVVPCCLDAEGVMNLGNLHDTKLTDILSSKRAEAIVEGFAHAKAVEELCRKCSYKERFNIK